MGFIYKIEVEGELYVGSTKNKYLCNRQQLHNYRMRTIGNKDYNIYLYRFCREKKVKKIICELLEIVEDSELRILEQEYINMLEPSLNTYRAYLTEEQRQEQKKKCDKITNKKKGNCPICGLEMLNKSIKRHIRNIHKS
tara:strand:+ start:73 stop:489 length:417 start_codon:yes stop_codon:yes gene_type:complete